MNLRRIRPIIRSARTWAVVAAIAATISGAPALATPATDAASSAGALSLEEPAAHTIAPRDTVTRLAADVTEAPPEELRPARGGAALHPNVAAALEVADSDRGTVAGGDPQWVPVIAHLRQQGGQAVPDDPPAAPRSLKSRHSAASAELNRFLDAEHAAGRSSAARALWIAGAVAVEAEPSVVRALASRSEVRLVTLDEPAIVEPWVPGPASVSPDGDQDEDSPMWNIDMIGAPDAWNSLGIDGTGSVVAVVDTGVDYHHPALGERYRGFVGTGLPSNGGNWWCKKPDPYCGFDTKYPADGVGHGTHVTGIAVGPEGIGVAPGASWIAAKVCQQLDTCRASWVMEALQWVLESEPDRLPDVVNLSLSIEDSFLLLRLVDALHDSDVVVVAASGNQAELVRAPAMYPNVVAVGAVTDEGDVWPRSGRGYSITYEYKPDVMAPGTAITSTVPGGGWARSSGTSMAAPHAAGTVALLRQANPDLTAAEIVDVLERTAVPMARIVPDPDSGWGLINAYQAVRSVMDVGQLRGTVVDAGDGEPIPWARVRVATEVGDPVAQADVSVDGSFAFDLAPDNYLVVAEAFTYRMATQRQVTVERDRETRLDFEMVPDEPVGYLAGTLADAETGVRLDGEIRIEGVPSRFVIPVDKHTGFSQRLPAATYRLRVARFGYRVLTDTVKVGSGVTIERDYKLTPAPRILLVDGDAWAYGGAVEFFRASLDRLGYVYHEWRVTDETAGPGSPGGPPTAEDLGDYDLVIWSSSITGPTYVMGARPIAAYLDAGGSLLLSGQDALCTDARTDNATDPCNEKSRPDPYVRDQLHLRVIRDSASSRTVAGSDGGPLAGMTLTLNGVDSMDNQSMPDVLGVVDELHTSMIAEYPGVGGAAALVGTCTPHRAVALGFGFEGIQGAGERDEVMDRLILALTDPLPEVGVHAQPESDLLLERPGAAALYTVTLHSTGTAPASYSISVADASWDTELWQGGFTRPLEQPVNLTHCQGVPFGVRVVVPEGARRGEGDTALLTVRGDTGAEQSLKLRTRTPAPVLVVDGDFARNTEERYLSALESAGVVYDVWELGLYESRPEPPPLSAMAGYPGVVWFTGDDWRQDGSLNVASQIVLADYLDGGGRLYFSSEDYLSIRGGTPFEGERYFHEDYLGVRTFAANEGEAHDAPVQGAPGSILDGVTGCTLRPKRPGEDYSDQLTPIESMARPSMLNAFGQTVATQAASGGFKSLFLALDAGQLDEACADAVMARSLDWFSPMHESRLTVESGSRRTFASGDQVRLKLQLLNDGPRAVDGVSVTWAFPEGGELDARWTPPTWSWDDVSRTLTWTGDIARNQRLVPDPEVVFVLDDDLEDGLSMASSAVVVAEGITITRRADWRVNAPDLRESNKSVPDPDRNLTRGDTAQFVINVRNTGTRDAGSFVVTDTLPSGLRLIPESVFVESGDPPDLDTVPGGIVWHGSAEVGRATSMSYSAQVTTYRGGWLRNRALLTDSAGESVALSAAVFARPTLLFPWAGAEIDTDP